VSSTACSLLLALVALQRICPESLIPTASVGVNPVTIPLRKLAKVENSLN
jgi:hypothetical protein